MRAIVAACLIGATVGSELSNEEEALLNKIEASQVRAVVAPRFAISPPPAAADHHQRGSESTFMVGVVFSDNRSCSCRALKSSRFCSDGDGGPR